MNIQQVQTVHFWLYNLGNNPNWLSMPVLNPDIVNIKNGLIIISQDISKEYPIFSRRLFELKDNLFMGYGYINPTVFGRVDEILNTIQENVFASQNDIWSLCHPQILKVSKKLYLDGHYADAACDAFIEINDRVKKLFRKLRPGESVPDGDGAMKAVFSANSPIIEFCDRSTQTGQNIQKGYMEMLAGAMSALRNPKSHANLTITAEDAMRRLMFASMLMYKIDEAVTYSGITE